MKQGDSALNNLPSEKEMTGIGVLADGCLLTWHPGTREIVTTDNPYNAVDILYLYRLACKHRLNSVWLCPGSRVSLALHEDPLEFVPAALHDHYKISVKRREEDGVPQNAKINPKEGKWGYKPLVYIMLPDHDPTWLEDQQHPGESWSFSDVENPRQFIATLITLYQKMGGVYLSTSPASTGVQSMKLLTREADWQRGDGELDLPDCMPSQIYWHRPFFPKEQGLYLHRGDRNAMFLGACTGAELGIGMPTYLDGKTAALAWERGLNAAIWNVEVTPAKKHGLLQPHKHEWEGPRWLTTSGVRAMHNLGYTCEVYRAWIWENDREKRIVRSRRVLRDYGQTTFQIRQQLRATYGKEHPAPRLLSMTYKRGLGWLDLQGLRRDKEEKPRWYHKRHWYAEIQALAQYRMTITMQMMLEKYGIHPVLVYADALLYVSHEADPRRAFPDLFRRETELGGFKPDLTLRIDEEVMAAFDQAGPANVLEHLKGIEARRHGTHV